MGFFTGHCWPPRNQLRIRAVQGATWKVNLRGAITVHATRKQCLYYECHSPDSLWATYFRSLLYSLQSNHPRVLYPFISVTILPLRPPSSPLLLMFLGHRAKWEESHENPGLIQNICWNLPQVLGSQLAGHPASQRTESSHLTLGGAPGKERCLSMVFQRQQVDRWKSEDSEARGRKTFERQPCCVPEVMGIVTLGCQHNEEHSGVKRGLVMHSTLTRLPTQGTVLDLLRLSHFSSQLALQQAALHGLQTPAHKYSLAESHFTPVPGAPCSLFQGFLAWQLVSVNCGVRLWSGGDRGNL